MVMGWSMKVSRVGERVSGSTWMKERKVEDCRRRRLSGGLFLAVVLPVLASCEGSEAGGVSGAANRAPVVVRVEVRPSSVALPGDRLELAVEVSDPEGDAVTVAWSAAAGMFDDVHALTTGYLVPDHLGPLDLTLQMMDSAGNSSTFTLPIVVGYEEEPDADRDGLTWAQGDCNDLDPAVSPTEAEVPDGIDNDCDGLVDEGSRVSDDDGDGQSELAGDCDDEDPTVYLGAQEGEVRDGVLVGDGIDNDCDGVVDEGTDSVDDDGDGYTDLEGDCLDTSASIHPGAEEVADGLDNDCDGFTDEGTVLSDDDGDGFSEVEGDCADTDATVYPGALELEDGLDNDCNGVVDDHASWTDDDGDGFSEAEGDCDDTRSTVYPGATETVDGLDNDCDQIIDEDTVAGDDDLDGYSETQGDCDDGRADVYPGAPELEDGVDNDCNGFVDEGTAGFDDDGDGYSEEEGDCDDGDPLVSPGVMEHVDGLDNDCDGEVDEGTQVYDDDGDGFSEVAGDCDDSRPDVYPGAEEQNDGVDNDCDGVGDPNSAPVAVAEVTIPETVCQEIELDGEGSYDPDDDPIAEYRWYVISRPDGSLAGDNWIEDAHSALARYVTDLPGDYTIGLLVSDGVSTSDVATVSFSVADRVFNTDPVAEAGDDQEVEATTHCAYSGDDWICPPCNSLQVALDGSGSVDPDGDRLFFDWTISSSTAPGAVLEGSLGVSPVLEIPAPPAEHGRTNTYAVLIKLEVTDCQGERDVDSLVVTYACTGL